MSDKLIALTINTPIDFRPGELRCPRCKSKDLAASMPRGMWDSIMQGAGRIPRHCRSCGKRFHARQEAIRRDLELRQGNAKKSSGSFTQTGY
jgi:hypothetical protein